MKKIIALLLMLALAFAMIACGDDEPTEEELAYQAAIAEYTKAAFVAPKTLTIVVSTDSVFGVLTSKYDVAYAEDGSATIGYSVDKINGLDSADEKSTLVGTINVDVNGNYSDGTFAGANPLASGVKLNLASETVTFTIAGDVLTGTIAAANTEAVLGVAIAADVVLTATKVEGKIISVALSYVLDGNTTNALCTYTY